MKNKIPCGIIRDLFPSYIEKLTSEESNREVEEHIAECKECARVLREMSGDEEDITPQIKEIDFLKKNRKKNRLVIASSIISVLLVIAIVAVTVPDIISNRSTSYGVFELADFGINMTYYVEVEDKNVQIDIAATDEYYSVRDISIKEEEGGIIKAATDIGPNVFGQKKFESSTLTCGGTVNEVYLDGYLVWKDGTAISPLTSELFKAAHPYMGDLGQNENSAAALNFHNIFGGFWNELHSSEAPYSWDINLKLEMSPIREELMKKYLTVAGYAIVATIDNLDSVKFNYTVADTFRVSKEEKALVVTQKDATEFAGEDIKALGKDIVKLQKFLETSGYMEFYESVFAAPYGNRYSENAVHFSVSDYHPSQEYMEYLGVRCIDADGEVVSCVFKEVEQNEYLDVFNLFAFDFGLDSFEDIDGYSIQLVYYGYGENGEYVMKGVASSTVPLSKVQNGTVFTVEDFRVVDSYVSDYNDII